VIYLIGSLRNPQVPVIAEKLRYAGLDVFDDWFAAGPEADDKWRDYERGRGRSFKEALRGYAARNVFRFDRTHLERARAVVLVLPAGKSGHLELGWALGKGKPGFILVDSPERWDVMYQFAMEGGGQVVDNVPSLIAALQETVGDEQHILERPSVRTQAKRDMVWCPHCVGYVEADSPCPFCPMGMDYGSHAWNMARAGSGNVRTGERD
jgi:hypothetical protein